MFSARHYIVLRGLCGSNIFSHFLKKKGKFFGKKLLNIKRVFLFFFAALCKTFLTVIKIPRDIIIVCVKQPLFLTNFNQI